MADLNAEHNTPPQRHEPLELRAWLAQAALASPNAPALDGLGGVLSYAALATAVTQRSRRLKDAGFGPGDRVAIAATRSQDTIISILACVDAGVGYVPLDLGYPAERILAMLESSRPRAVLGEPEALDSLRRLAGETASLEHPAPAFVAHAALDDLTYVLFTSGSTGMPKGVAMGQRPLQSLIAWHAAHPRLGLPARTLQFAPLSFDVHFQEIFSTIATRGTLVLLPETLRRDPSLLHAAFTEHRIERIFVPYVALQMLAEASRDQVPASLRDVISAGEQLQITPAIRSLFSRLPGSELHNHYGPTESHVVTAHELRGDAASWPEIPPIGMALPHVKLALRDPETGQLDAADTGELLLGGETLAHGYLGQPELSAERFRTDIPGLRGCWYVTGDLVKHDASGTHTYLGRADQQVKVDGFRIEPGEIELMLMTHPAIKDAVVTAPDLPGIGKQLVAYLILRDPAAELPAITASVRALLRQGLPEYMVPVRYELLDRLPTTPSGKIDRRNLPLPKVEAVKPADSPAALARALWQELLGLPQIGDDQNLFDLGARSLLVLRFVARLKELGVHQLSVADVYDRPTLGGITAALQGHQQRQTRRAPVAAGATRGIAIVGMASRTAGAEGVDAFWNNLMAEREGIRHFAPHELDASVPESVRSRPNFVAARGVLDDVARFDAGFFNMSAREATVVDPQQRLMLELCWSALEHAAIDPSRDEQRIGVYAGTGNNSYAPALREQQPELVQQYGEFAVMLASEKDYVATRVSHRLNLNGPALSIHTACSTGLVAVAQAWHALASGQCDVALAGGTSVVVPQEGGYLHVEGGMESADGHCRPFDADASGTIFASGGGVVVLKRLEDALSAGDVVYGVIRGVGINNDGGDKASFTAPSVSGQAGAIRMALDHAQVGARSIGYVEAHGTGTSLGDPIEVAALTRAWREDTADKQFCGLGSVKSNLGHMVAAAGVVGLIKTSLALHHEMIPATLHFKRPNAQIDFANTPFHVIAKPTPWLRSETPRRAAVSSFGVGGTNAHVIVEEAPASNHATPADDGRLWVLPLSAQTGEAALRRARDLADHLDGHPELPLSAVAHTLMRGRKPMAFRLSVSVRDRAAAGTALRGVRVATKALSKPRVVFLFPGQGSQHPGMARRLYDEVPAFREALDQCLAVAEPLLNASLREWLVEAEPTDAVVAEHLAETRHAQPALFCISYALAAWLDSLGVKPTALIGHSIGEYAAACVAGVFTLRDAVTAVVARGQAMFGQPRGAMLAVRTDAAAVSALLVPGVEIAGCNAPNLTVVAGSATALDAFAAALEARDIGTTRLKVSHAFHSESMDGALPKISAALAGVALHAPTAPVYSCVSGLPLQATEATDPQYWARQVRATVQFSRAVQAELLLGDTVFVEVGPGQALTALMRQHRTPKGEVPRVVSLLGPANDPGDAGQSALNGLGALWSAGIDVAWPVAANAKRVALPTYPFGGERHWFTRRAAAPAAAATAAVAPDSTSLPLAPAASQPVLLPEVIPAMSRLPRLEQELTRILSEVSGIAVEEMTSDASFVDQGLDSLSLTQATLELERVFGIKLRFRRLLEDLDSVGKLAQFLDAELPADKFAPPPPAPRVAEPVASAVAATAAMLPPPVAVTVPMQLAPAMQGGAASAPFVQQLISQQMQLMSQQLALIAGQPSAMLMPAALTAPTQSASTQPSATVASASIAPLVATNTEPGQPSIRSLIEKPFGAAARITLDNKQDFTPQQRRWIDDFVQRYNARSGKSKAFSQQHRKVMADPRVVTGFNPLWKDLVYPLVVERSKGARLWDLDGNEYIDLLSCFGGNLLGYQPDALLKAMVDQLHAGIEVGPQHPLAAEVAQLISEFTGMERVAFCNTGSEAVMGAMRVARTVTGRKTIAIFTNSYHGIFDEVIVRGTKQLRSLSAAPGILANAVENILVLDWNSEDSLRILRERGSELAAIMTEPIQNKYPTIQPREFVQSLRRIADEAGCALIFDEVVTGFRVAPGGAQEFYGVRADLATYGKVIGGGLPFAAIGGGSRWLDALDGGHWQYGDDSYPEAGVTYFAGTFVRHPLALAAARASLLHLKRGGREFYRTLNDRTQRMIERLNTAFAARGAPVKAVHCASIWRLTWDDNQKYVSLFYYLVRFHGLHLYEQFGHFVTEAMGEAELDRIFNVFTQALDELMALGFIAPRDGTPPAPDKRGSEAPPGDAPLTPGQTERWLAASFDPHARRALNESLCLSLQGPIDLSAMELAVRDVLSRHEAFKVHFDTAEPMQRLDATNMPTVHRVNLNHEPDAEAALDRFCELASLHDFAMDAAPLARVSLISLADGRNVVHVVVSHLVFDGWATPVFLTDLATAYRARSTGLAPQWQIAESPRRFAIDEQARWEGAQGRESMSYWTTQLKNPPAPLCLGDRSPPSRRLYSGDTLRAKIDGDLLTALQQLARQHKATMFQLLLAAVAVVVQRRTGQEDFVVSIPFASQSLDRHGPLIGDGVLDLPLRLRSRKEDDFAAVLGHVRNQLMDALEHPLATQGSVARAVGVVSSGNRPPLTGVFFNLNPRLDLRAFAPLQAEVREGRKLGLLSEVIFNFYETPHALTLDLHHSTEFFSPQRAADLVAALQLVLHELVGPRPELAESVPVVVPAFVAPTVPTVPARDLDRLAEWNATDTPYETGLRLGDLIRRSVASHPHASAVRFEGRDVSYAELDRMAWALAHRLRDMGVRPGDLVGVCLDRSVELVAALVGVVYSGGAYVPLDPAYPRERVTNMCEDARLRVVVTRDAELARTATAFSANIDFVKMDAALMTQPAKAGELIGTTDDPAYVIFTSGSTGRPKGAMNAHKGIVNRLQWMQQEYLLTSQDRVIQKTPYSFDVSVWEFFWPLMTGATIIVARPDGHRDATYLAELIHSEAVTVLHFVPSMLRLFLEEPRGEQCRSVRQVLCSGEALPIDAVDRFFESVPHARLGNLYGPTEAAVDVTCWNCEPNDTRRIVPIGRPIANTRMYVLGEQLQLLPVGQEGELYIGGVQVGMGYMSRPDLTQERFLPDPFLPGGRMYKTGDVGRWLDDGVIEYIGRADHQVKIRGNRIELGEIEATLVTHPQISRCVVVASDFGGGDVRLVAYSVARGTMPDAAALKAHLSAHLPEYMLPQHFVALQEIPLLPNGKIDRKALPPPAEPQPSAGAGEAPRTELEASVAEVTRGMLKLQTLGIHDDFFAMGGHSLLAARVIAQLNKRLGTQLTLRTMFEAPTVAKLAATIAAQRDGSAPEPKRAPIVARADQSRAPLTLMQERIRFLEEMQPGRVVYNAPSAHRLKGSMNLVAFDRAFSEMIQRQPALRTSIVADKGGFIQRIDKVSFTLLPLEDLSHLTRDEREAHLLQRLDALTAETFSLENGPLFKARLFKLTDDEHALFFMTHHVIWDGWSFDVLYNEISTLYEAFSNGSAPTLPPLPVTYGDYAHWHQDLLKSQELADQIGYWKKQFAQGPMPRQPLGDYPRQLAGGGRGATEWMHIDNPHVEQIRDIAKRTGSTLSIVILSLYAAMMAQWLRDPCPAIGMPVRGRNAVELEGVMGFFNNMLPIRLQVDTQMSCLDWIRSVRKTMVDGFASQDAPFELLAQELESGQTGPSHLYQVMFSFQDARARQTHWGQLAHERIPLLQRGATEDLNLWMVEIPNGIEGGLQYNADLFLPSTVAALRDRLLSLMDDLVRRPDQSVAELVRLRQPDVDLLARWGHSQAVAVVGDDFLDMIERRARTTPQRIAIHRDEEQISYGQLARRVDEFEALLRGQQVQPGGSAVLRVADSVAHLVACLALLRVGSAVVCLAAGAPADELERAAQRQGTSLLVCDHSADATVAPTVRRIDSTTIPGHRPSKPPYTATADHGTTPEPVDRSMLADMLAALATDLTLLESDRALVFAGDERDLQLFIAAQALSAGAEWVVAPDEVFRDVERLGALLTEKRISLMHASGATWRAALSGTQGRSLDLIAMIDVTESNADLVQTLLDRGCTVMSVFRSQTLSMPVAAGLVQEARDHMVFGRPLIADSFAIVDSGGKAVPPGVAGELHLVQRLAGTTTATRTLARWRSDGVLQYLGELDSVAYVEGRRVALDQFAERINALPGVEVAAVSVRDDAALHRCLVIGLQLKEGVPSEQTHWEAAVHALIPGLASMRIHIGPLARLPNGSIDLSAITSRRRASGAEAELLTPTQRAIAEVWQNLLGLTDVGLQDNFFDLGGTSLGAMQAAHRLEQRLGGRRISPRRYVFETLAQIAAAFDDVTSETEVEAVVSEPAAGGSGRSRTFVEKLKRLVGGT